jgi:hypothetical protein
MENEESMFIGMKNGSGFKFLPLEESFKPGAKKGGSGFYYLTEQEWNSLLAYLKGDFSHGVA